MLITSVILEFVWWTLIATRRLLHVTLIPAQSIPKNVLSSSVAITNVISVAPNFLVHHMALDIVREMELAVRTASVMLTVTTQAQALLVRLLHAHYLHHNVIVIFATPAIGVECLEVPTFVAHQMPRVIQQDTVLFLEPVGNQHHVRPLRVMIQCATILSACMLHKKRDIPALVASVTVLINVLLENV